jgi:hypothetical protein
MTTPACCNAPMCTRRAAAASRFCSAHRVTRRTPEGTPVRFVPTMASLALYSLAPAVCDVGTVTTVPLPGGRRTYLPGPGGGLLYVQWAAHWNGPASEAATVTCGISPLDCCKA